MFVRTRGEDGDYKSRPQPLERHGVAHHAMGRGGSASADDDDADTTVTGDPIKRQILAVLGRYMSPMNAKAVLRHVVRALPRASHPLSRKDVQSLVAMLRSQPMLFADARLRERLFSDLDELVTTGAPAVQAAQVVLRSQQDLPVARSVARKLCQDMGASGFAEQKTITVVSELARNIIAYAGTGSIEISPLAGGKRLLVRALDSGPGIPNLEQVLAGQHRSRTGLGLGLVGVKRLASSFRIDSSPSGTRVEAEIAL
jgi:serine/threonine-protein kinase RsbT